MKANFTSRLPLAFALCAFGLTLISAELPKRELRVRWNANKEADLAGYRIRSSTNTMTGTNSGRWQREVDVGLSSTNTITISNKPTFLHVIAYNSMGLQSDPSNELQVDWPDAPVGVSVVVTFVFSTTNSITVP